MVCNHCRPNEMHRNYRRASALVLVGQMEWFEFGHMTTMPVGQMKIPLSKYHNYNRPCITRCTVIRFWSILEWDVTQKNTPGIVAYWSQDLKKCVSKIAAAWPSRKRPKTTIFFSFFGHFAPKNWPKFKILGIFGILSSRRIRWCALLLHCSKKFFLWFFYFSFFSLFPKTAI